MRKLGLFPTIVCIIMIVGCTQTSANIPITTPTTFQKQPEPQSPLIKGQFSGLPDNTLITIHISKLSGQEIQWGTRPGNGAWESVVPDNPDMDYIVTAEVDGYNSNPLSYTIHVDGKAAFLIENGLVTTKEALHLDFQFEPVATATQLT